MFKRLFYSALVFAFIAIPYATVLSTTASAAESQQSRKTVSGVVKDVNGTPVVGAIVMVPNTTNGVETDLNGRYAISIPSATTFIEVSNVGFKTQQVQIGKAVIYDVTLLEDAEILDDVVVVGYGTMKRSNLTGAITSVKSEALRDTPVKSVSEALQGKIAGVYVSKGTGVGASSNIIIRGAGSVNGLAPLYIIDGVEGGNNVGMNMEDIESIEVIKDASAAAIYGSKAAGGVILITTKKGAAGTPKVTFTGQVGLSTAGKTYDLLNTGEYLQMRSETTGTLSELYEQWKKAPNSLPDTDWVHELNLDGTGLNQQYGLSLSGQSGKINYYLSGQYQKEDGIQFDWWRYFSTLAKVEYQVTPKLKIGTRFSASKTNNNNSTVGWGEMMRSVPFMNVREEDGSFTPVPESAGSNAVDNPVAALNRKNHQNNGNIAGNARLYLDWEIIKGLKFNVTGSATFGSSYGTNYVEPNTTRVTYDADSFTSSESHAESYRYYATLSYDKVFAKIHALNVMLGYEAGWALGHSISGTGTGSKVENPLSFTMVSTKANSTRGLLETKDRYISQFARINYTLLDRYLITANIRRDGNTKFGSNNRFGIFPSVSVGWKLSEEPWFKNANINWVSSIKPRFSYGSLGNSAPLEYYSYNPAYSALTGAGFNSAWKWITYPANYSFDGTEAGALNGYSMTKVTNKDIKWETIVTIDAGIDIALFNNRLEASFDWYNRHTIDMIYHINMPSFSGVGGQMPINIGSISNKGVEFSINWKDKVGDFNYAIGANISHNTNIMEDIGDTEATISAGSLSVTNNYSPLTTNKGTHYTVNNAAIGRLYGFKTAGIYKSQAEVDADNAAAVAKGFNYYQTAQTSVGDLKFVDLNGDGHIDSEDADFIGNPWPKVQYGGSVYLEWKGIDFSASIVGLAGRDVVNGMISKEYLFQTDYQTTTKIFKTSFVNGNGLTDYPRVYHKDDQGAVIRDPNGNYQVMSDFMVEDGSYCKIKDITLGYTLPNKITRKAKIEKARLFFTGHNLITITKFSGLDPEFDGGITSFGQYSAGIPMTKLFIFGLDITFGGNK